MRSARIIVAALIALLALLPACAGTYAKLGHEDTDAAMFQLKHVADDLPRRTVLVPTTDEEGRTVRLALHEIDGPATDRVIVLIHGAFSDSDAWRFVAPSLARSADIVMVDLPGCGQSDKPRPRKLEPEGYSPFAMAIRVLQALRAELIEGRPAPRITLAGHSLAGQMIIRMFGEESIRSEYADVLDHVDRLVLHSPVDVAVKKDDPVLVRLSTVSGLEIRLAAALGVLQDEVALTTFESCCDPSRATHEEADNRMRILADPELRLPLQAMLLQAVPSRSPRPNWPEIERIVAGYSRVDVPCLILWGTRDELLPLSMGYKLAAQIPGAHLVPVPRAMHSIQVERPELFISLVTEFIETGRPPEQTVE